MAASPRNRTSFVFCGSCLFDISCKTLEGDWIKCWKAVCLLPCTWGMFLAQAGGQSAMDSTLRWPRHIPRPEAVGLDTCRCAIKKHQATPQQQQPQQLQQPQQAQPQRPQQPQAVIKPWWGEKCQPYLASLIRLALRLALRLIDQPSCFITDNDGSILYIYYYILYPAKNKAFNLSFHSLSSPSFR